MRWTDKYSPKSFEEIVGNGKQRKVVETWVKNWKEGIAQPPLLLVGPAGTGKTTMAHIIASEFSDYIELNASDKRSYDIIMNTVGESATTKSFFTGENEHKLIIFDEVDGIHGNDDRGGTRAIGKIIKESIHPIVMTANDFYSKRLASIKPKCQVVKIGKVHTNSVNAQLKRIAAKEEIVADPEAIRKLAKGSNGDMRSALNTFQAIAEKSKKFTMDDFELVSQKDNTNNIFDSVRRVLKSKSMDKIKQSLRLDEDPTLVMEYIAENIPREYEKPKEIRKAYEMISEADLYFGRARQTRDYTYWRYATEFMGIGVAISKDETYKKFTRLTGAMAFSLMGRTRGKRALRDKIAQKMSEKLHMSNSEAIAMFPYLEIMFENNDLAYDISRFLDFDEDEIKRFRKRKIPKSVIKRKEKEWLEELAKKKELERDKNKLIGSEIKNSSKTIETEEVADEEVSNQDQETESSEEILINHEESENLEDSEEIDEKEENVDEVESDENKKDSAQKSLFNF